MAWPYVAFSFCYGSDTLWLSFRASKTLKQDLGEAKWEELKSTYPAVLNCGFTDQEIQEAGDLPLFHRRTANNTTDQSDQDGEIGDSSTLI